MHFHDPLHKNVRSDKLLLLLLQLLSIHRKRERERAKNEQANTRVREKLSHNWSYNYPTGPMKVYYHTFMTASNQTMLDITGLTCTAAGTFGGPVEPSHIKVFYQSTMIH